MVNKLFHFAVSLKPKLNQDPLLKIRWVTIFLSKKIKAVKLDTDEQKLIQII